MNDEKLMQKKIKEIGDQATSLYEELYGINTKLAEKFEEILEICFSLSEFLLYSYNK